ncbi:MAG: COX15/CtaA family protein [Chitinophagales bacterium]
MRSYSLPFSSTTFAGSMPMSHRKSSPAIARWVLLGVIMLLVQVLLGGITRLTGSGLSITEWNIFMGTIPPLNENQWQLAFAKYRETPQFHLLNADFELSDFKFIFFWEWFHRLWARLVGVVFLLGFFYFLAKKELKRNMIRPLLILFLLGALQGAVGWIMVLSGLTGDEIYVKPLKLALHFVFALCLISYAFWFWLELAIPRRKNKGTDGLKKLSMFILGVLFIQLIYGALMAGGKLANVAPDWPTINGEWIPDSLFSTNANRPFWLENKIAVQFIHRGLAYLLVLLVVIWTIISYKPSISSYYIHRFRTLPLFNVGLQVLLGIMTVLLSTEIVPNHWVAFDWFALAHQVIGMLFVLSMVFMIYSLRSKQSDS